MSDNLNNFNIFRLLTLSFAGLLYLWFFFDLDLSKYSGFKDYGLENSLFLPYIVVVLLFFFLFETLLSFQKIENWRKKIQFLVVIVFSLSSVIVAYPKLVMETFLNDTTRRDLMVPFVIAVMSSMSAIQFRIKAETALEFHKLRGRLLKVQWIEIALYSILALAGILILFITSRNLSLMSYSLRTIIFLFSFLFIFLYFIPKRKIYTQERLSELKKMSDFFDRQEELSNMPFEIKPEKRKYHKNIMKKLVDDFEKQRKSIKLSFEFLKNVNFVLEGEFVKPEDMEPEEEVICIYFKNKRTDGILKRVNIKFKYIKLACQQVRGPKEGNDLRSFFEPMIGRAYRLQRKEENPNEVLFEMSAQGILEEVKDVIENNHPNINYAREDGWTPMLIAVANGHSRVVEYLLQKAANPIITNKMGATPLHFAAWYGNQRLCKTLINYGAKVNQQDCEGLTPMMRATNRGHGSIVKFLLENGADPNIIDSYLNSALIYAERGNYGDIAKILRNSLSSKK